MATTYDSLKSRYKSTLANKYVKAPISQSYNLMRGVTDFTNVGQFNQYETGYGQLFVLKKPKFMEELAKVNSNVAPIVTMFDEILEYEFRGIDGIPDISVDHVTITNGIQEIQMINKVTMDTSITVSMNYFERSGLPITKYSQLYLTGIKDKVTQAKHYHGLIAANIVKPSYENEVFTFLYVNTDNTGLAVEGAVLLTNAQLNNARQSIVNATRGEINNQELTLEFTCYPVMNEKVDEMAKNLLEASTGITVTNGNQTYNYAYNGKKFTDEGSTKNHTIDTVLNSNSYYYKAFENVTYGNGSVNYSPTKNN